MEYGFPGKGINNVYCTNATTCSTSTKETSACFAAGTWQVQALGRHGSYIDTPTYEFVIGVREATACVSGPMLG
jgi:hypothetical protein